MMRSSNSTIDCLVLKLALALAVFTLTASVRANAALAASAFTKITVGYPSPSPRVAPLWIAQDLDFFGKYGLTAQVVLVRNNQMLSAGIAAGDIDIGYTGGATVLGAAAAGVELKMIAGFVSRGRGFLVVKPEIRRPAELAGKRFGVQSIGGTLWMYAMLTLEQFGLDSARDRIQFMIVGDQTVMIRALETHLVDATVLTSRTYSLGLKQKGFTVLAEVTPAMASTGIVTRKSFLEKNPTTVENAMKALLEGEYYTLAAAGKPQVIKTVVQRLKLADASLAEEGYADVLKEFERKPYPSMDGLRNMQRLLAMQNPKLADINAANLTDITFMRKLEESGFIAQLQARYRE